MTSDWRKLEETREIRVSEVVPPRRTVPQPVEAPNPRPFPWYLLTGLVLGFLLGLAYAWLINPVVYSNTEPTTLRTDFKETYRLTIAQAFAASGDLARAESRLALLNDEEPVFMLGTQAQQALAAGFAEDARALALLASALQAETTIPLPTASP